MGIPPLLEDTVSAPWLPFPVINLTEEKDLVQRFAKTHECGVLSYQYATQVMKINILFMSFYDFPSLVHHELTVLSDCVLFFILKHQNLRFSSSKKSCY